MSASLVLATKILLLAKSSAYSLYDTGYIFFMYVLLWLQIPLCGHQVYARHIFYVFVVALFFLWLRITSELTSARSTSRFTVALMANRQPSLQCSVNLSSSKKAYLPIIGSSTLHGSWIMFNKDWNVLLCGCHLY